MIKALIRRFVPDYEQVKDKQVRQRYAVLAGILGMCGNAVLFVLKLTIGILMNSISVISDAFNNLSDMGTSAVLIFSAKMSNKKPDKEHPFGHGRIEYLASLAVAVLILVVG
ncbi:MAG: cation diffusion facilitator family transporter, partial [Clostridia bacterium]|nr:cation diffusion facilitator family transporter [Clostridia bacterium]